MMSNILIIVLHVKQTHKLPVEPPLLASSPRETCSSEDKRPTRTSPNEVSDTQLGSLMITRVLLATSGNINPQDPIPKPATELQDSAKSKCWCMAAVPSSPRPQTTAPHSTFWFLSCLVQLTVSCRAGFAQPPSHLLALSTSSPRPHPKLFAQVKTFSSLTEDMIKEREPQLSTLILEHGFSP